MQLNKFSPKKYSHQVSNFSLLYISILSSFLFISLNCKEIPSGQTTYVSKDIKNSDQNLVIKLDSLGHKLVEGLMWQDKRNGSWVTYFPSGQIESITNYIEGKKNGAFVKMTSDNRIAECGAYKDDLLEGVFIRYLYGFKDEQLEFHAGKKNGWVRKYYMGGGVQREMQFKDDVQNGLYRFYAEDGLKMIEETYKDGKKTGGGIVLEQ